MKDSKFQKLYKLVMQQVELKNSIGDDMYDLYCNSQWKYINTSKEGIQKRQQIKSKIGAIIDSSIFDEILSHGPNQITIDAIIANPNASIQTLKKLQHVFGVSFRDVQNVDFVKYLIDKYKSEKYPNLNRFIDIAGGVIEIQKF